MLDLISKKSVTKTNKSLSADNGKEAFNSTLNERKFLNENVIDDDENDEDTLMMVESSHEHIAMLMMNRSSTSNSPSNYNAIHISKFHIACKYLLFLTLSALFLINI